MKSQFLNRVLITPGALWLTAMYIIPVVILIATAFAAVNLVGQPDLSEWHLGNFKRVFQSYFWPLLGRSFGFAVLSTLICLVLGFLVSYTLVRFGGRFKNFFLLLLILPWFVDYLIRVYAWVQLFHDSGFVMNTLHSLGIGDGIRLIGTPAAVVTGLVYNYIPFMILPIYVLIEQLDTSIFEAGRDLYASSTGVLFSVIFPLAVPAIISGSVVVFLFSFTDFAIPQFLGGPDLYMIGNLIQDQFRGIGSLPIGSAVTVVMLAFIILSLLVLPAVLKKFTHRKDA